VAVWRHLPMDYPAIVVEAVDVYGHGLA
jgi:hypothetical protein